MKVAHVITRLIVGGAQENTVASVLGLRAKPGLELKLIAGPATGPEGSLEAEVAKVPGLLTIVPELIRAVHPWKDFIALRKLTAILRREQPDIVHTHSSKAGILGRLAAERAGVPIIIHHIHGPPFSPLQNRLKNFLYIAAERRAARATHHFIVVAGAMTRKYLAAGIGQPGQFTKIFSGFPVELFSAPGDALLRGQLGFAPEDFVIGKIARLVPHKGHQELLTALREILPACPRARALLVGDGELRAEVERLSRDMGLTNKVVFTGLVPPCEVPRYLGVMDCLAHLSTFPEGLPRALPQALAAGKPIVSYDCDGAAEVCFEGRTGFLIRSGDVNAATRRLLQLATDAPLRNHLGAAGREFVLSNFGVEKMIDDQYALYLKLAAERRVAT